MCEFLQNIGLGDFPLYTALFQGDRAVLVLAQGTPRVDADCILFTPEYQPVGVAGLPPPPPVPPHFSYISYDMTAPDGGNLYVVFSDVYLGPVHYWHATRPSAEYDQMASIGRACLCQHRCKHEGDFSSKLAFSFYREGISKDLGLANVTKVYNAQYSHGKDDALMFKSSSGEMFKQKNAFTLSSKLDFRECRRDNLVTNGLVITLYFAQKRESGDYKIGAFIATFCSFFACVRLQFLKETNRWTQRTLMMKLNRGDCVSRSLLSCTLDYAAYYAYPIGSACSIFFACIAASRTYGYFFPSRWPKALLNTNYYRGHVPETLKLRQSVLAGRLESTVALNDKWSEIELRALVRRLGHEMQYTHNIDPYEIDNWIARNMTSEGSAPIPALPLGSCVSCFRKRKLKHLQCAQCRQDMKNCDLFFPVTPYLISHVGMRPIFSQRPRIDYSVFERWRDLKRPPTFSGNRFGDLYSFVEYVSRSLPPTPSQRGRLCGPMFCGVEPVCFDRGDAITAIAVAVRMCVLPPCHPYDEEDGVVHDFVREYEELWAFFLDTFGRKITPLQPWTRQQVLDHQNVTAKRLLLERSYREIDEGRCALPLEMFRVKCFTKSEKHFSTTYSDFSLVNKTKTVPRCINPVHPHLNALLSPYTLPTSKALNAIFSYDTHVFYASGVVPERINDFLNAASVNRYILEDDVSMMDASHSKGSFEFQSRMLERQWPNLDLYIMSLIEDMRHGRLSFGRFRAFIQYVNLSGVPLTSWTNTLVCIAIRLFALLYAYRLVDGFHDLSWVFADQLLEHVYTAAAGDDGISFLPRSFNGVETLSEDFLLRYCHAWSMFGFSVTPSKVRVFNPSNWRLATFLAMRPVWSGQRYEYGVEPARRLRSLFWQIDNNMHPIAWGRGIATSLLKGSSHVPVVSDICRWYLNVTKGPVNEIDHTHSYSSFYGYEVKGKLNDRGIIEFCSDYSIPIGEYRHFVSMLDSIGDPFVNLNHPVLEAIFLKE